MNRNSDGDFTRSIDDDALVDCVRSNPPCVTASEVADEFDLAGSTARDRLHNLADSGQIERVRRPTDVVLFYPKDIPRYSPSYELFDGKFGEYLLSGEIETTEGHLLAELRETQLTDAIFQMGAMEGPSIYNLDLLKARLGIDEPISEFTPQMIYGALENEIESVESVYDFLFYSPTLLATHNQDVYIDRFESMFGDRSVEPEWIDTILPGDIEKSAGESPRETMINHFDKKYSIPPQDVIDLLESNLPAMTTPQIAEALDVPKSTARDVLKVYGRFGLISRERKGHSTVVYYPRDLEYTTYPILTEDARIMLTADTAPNVNTLIAQIEDDLVEAAWHRPFVSVVDPDDIAVLKDNLGFDIPDDAGVGKLLAELDDLNAWYNGAPSVEAYYDTYGLDSNQMDDPFHPRFGFTPGPDPLIDEQISVSITPIDADIDVSLPKEIEVELRIDRRREISSSTYLKWAEITAVPVDQQTDFEVKFWCRVGEVGDIETQYSQYIELGPDGDRTPVECDSLQIESRAE
ncbi:MAG: hypothetical protein ABEI86_03385 [Halobacteriaceae archaeon]